MLKDLVGPVRAKELEEELGELIENLQILGYKEVKPWAEFLSAMKPPAQWDAKHLEQRATTNFLYYRSNYLIICALIILFRIIMSPLTLFSIILTTAVVSYITVMVKVPFMIGEHVIDNRKKNLGSIGVAVVILTLSGTLSELFWSIFIAVSLCLAHMLFRARSISSKMNKVQEEVKLNNHAGVAPSGNGSGSHASKIVSNVNSLISEVFQNASATSKAKKQDLSVPNDVSGSNSPNPDSSPLTTDDDIESHPTRSNDNSPYHPAMSMSIPSSTSATGSAVKRGSPTGHGRAPGKSD